MVFDLLFFYIFFEFLLIPMFVIIGVWGSRERKLTAAFRFFFYFNRFNFFLGVIVYIYMEFGTTNLYKLFILNNIFNVYSIYILVMFIFSVCC